MSLKQIETQDFKKLFAAGTPLIDVRAPVEFAAGAFPNAINLPLLNNEEREKVGIEYKQNGQEAAISLGHKLVSGEVKSTRVGAWLKYIEKNPKAILYCYRGGKRSQISQAWLAEQGVEIARIDGGYKKLRHFLMDHFKSFVEKNEFVVVGGYTGSGKTDYLKSLAPQHAILDLEMMAQHRGSAFGQTSTPQPSQIDFEHALYIAALKLEDNLHGPVYIEDESRCIGKVVLPDYLFEKKQQSKVLFLRVPLEKRITNILRDYVIVPIGENSEHITKLLSAVERIKKSLGYQRAHEVAELMRQAHQEYLASGSWDAHRAWIEILLTYYYDPKYEFGLQKKTQVEYVDW